MQTKWDFAGSIDMWSTSAGGHLMKVVNLTGFTVYACTHIYAKHTHVYIYIHVCVCVCARARALLE
jgi:hypothetical protein